MNPACCALIPRPEFDGLVRYEIDVQQTIAFAKMKANILNT